jgi:hypothetical protein
MNADSIDNEPQSEQTRTPRTRSTWPMRILGGTLAAAVIYLVTVLGLTFYWCQQPPTFEVAATIPDSAFAADGKPIPGTALVSTTIRIGEILLDKPGGFLYNDIAPPGVLIDNCPSWECGVLMALRDTLRSLRNDFSRSQSQSLENDDVRRADLQFAIDPKSWMFPTAEDEYRQGLDALRHYRDTMTGKPGGGHFFARADNPADYLNVIEKRLGNQASRLSSSIANRALTAALIPNLDGTLTTAAAPDTPTQTPWDQVDNVFYCTRGYSWALLHVMQAIAVDFRDILEAKSAQSLVQQIIRDLQGAIQTMSSPIVLNGDGYGVFANHSLTIASYISRVNASVLDLKTLLQDG